MIVLFSSNTKGGIIQFAMAILNALSEMQIEARCFLPNDSEGSVSGVHKCKIVYYKKPQKIGERAAVVRQLSERVLALSPALIWYCENAILDCELTMLIRDKCKQMLTLHDGATLHPTYEETLGENLKNIIKKCYTKLACGRAERLLLLSDCVKRRFEEQNPKWIDKIVTMNLCAHIPAVEESAPIEMTSEEPYYMFFGRIDKYKGLIHALRGYVELQGSQGGFVIAGKGIMTEEEKKIIDGAEDILLINRYISDGEMVWLFRHARAVVLPYVEATQSGVIPIAYKYGVPVIVSNVTGLTQFVEEGRTGFIARSEDDYGRFMRELSDNEKRKVLSRRCREYSEENLNWHKNIRQVLDFFSISS